MNRREGANGLERASYQDKLAGLRAAANWLRTSGSMDQGTLKALINRALRAPTLKNKQITYGTLRIFVRALPLSEKIALGLTANS